MSSYFCPRDCEYLSITEAEQARCNTHWPHVCLKYDIKLYHLCAHPELYRCEKCFEENKE